MILIENEFLAVSLDPKGAELQSLKSKKNGIEYLWSGDDKFWGKHSPILFPIVGTLKDNTYFFQGKEYHLPRHGFARERYFIPEQSEAGEQWFLLSQDEQSLEVYPFNFELRLGYQLKGNSLNCTYRVTNMGDGDLWFSIGGHPAFAVPMVENTSYNDYYLKFSHVEPLERHKLENGLISDTVENLPVHDGILQLNQQLFDDDAIVIKNCRSTSVKLASIQHEHGLDFDFSGFPYLGLWAAKDAPFLCIEPWSGIADGIHHNQQLEQKEGIQTIAPGINWERTWCVQCF